MVKQRSKEVAPDRAIWLATKVCRVAGDPGLIGEVRARCALNGDAAAVQARDDRRLFENLVWAFNFQGISDAAARSYWTKGGGVTHAEVTRGLADGDCPKLAAYWTFERCGYRKGAWPCGEPRHRRRCPLPAHDLRNGRLNQTAYSLRLFLRDLCADDLVGWIDHQLAEVDPAPAADWVYRLGRAVIDPMKGVFGASDKVLNMALSDLLIGADADRALWVAAGGGMVAIDTLVHNWLHRTGLIALVGRAHRYGLACYQALGCAAAVRRISTQIDARLFNSDHPRDFPRFLEHAIWQFCALDRIGRCNGVRIDDRNGCDDRRCPLGKACDRAPLFPPPGRGPIAARTP